MPERDDGKRIPLVEVPVVPAAGTMPVEPTPRDDFAQDQVGPGRRVALHFHLALADGEVIDDCFGRPPASFTVGDGSLLPGFERALYGLRAGEEIDVLLPPAQAFGEPSEDNLHTFPRFRFPADLVLSEGLMIDFAGQGGYSQAGVVKHFDAARVQVDFNHPLAGRTIRFRARIVTVSPGADEPY